MISLLGTFLKFVTMPKDIRYLSKRRINQLTISQVDNFPSTSRDICRNNYIIQESRVRLDLNTTLLENENNIDELDAISLENENNNLIYDTVTSSVDACHNTNVDSTSHSTDSEIVDTDVNSTYDDKDHTSTHASLECATDLGLTRRNLVNDLRSWVIKEYISHTAPNNLLDVLRAHGHESDLPHDARTIMKTPKRATKNIKEINNGCYIHFGIRNGIKRLLTKYFDTYPNRIEIQINCDGISIFKSSNSQFWPILVLICTPFRTDPFIAGVHYGSSKPGTANTYLTDFVNEMIDIQNNGIHLNDTICEVVIEAIICDAPARAFITCTKSHAGYFGCSKCIQEGTWKSCVVFPECNSAPRTDQSFRNKDQIDHHTGISILEQLQIDMVSQIALDYMHLVCLGVMKRLLNIWLEGPRHLRLTEDKQKKLSEMLINTRSEIPYEFARLPRSLKEHVRWKATEFRQFLLYLGPVLLKDILHKDYYVHFLTFSIAIRILCHSELCLSMNDYAYNLLLYFVSHFPKLYGTKYDI